MKVKAKFSDIARLYAGRIILMHRGAGIGKTLAFTPLHTPDYTSGIRCQCGHAVWNATNFGNTVHFCPSKVYEVEVTDFVAEVKTPVSWRR